FAGETGQIFEILNAAIEARVPMFQIREKQLSAKHLFTLTSEAVKIARGSETRIFVNDRADSAAAACADGVQLTEISLPPDVVRLSFPGLLLGVSTHSVGSVAAAARAGADFALFGPIFGTPGKLNMQGLDKLRQACDAAVNFPVVAIGGIDGSNIRQVFRAGASGFASIRFLNSKENLRAMSALIAEVQA
ncbi:MAG: thiamine phosphate synthase, partial [Candidatus Binatia bacterium]